MAATWAASSSAVSCAASDSAMRAFCLSVQPCFLLLLDDVLLADMKEKVKLPDGSDSDSLTELASAMDED